MIVYTGCPKSCPAVRTSGPRASEIIRKLSRLQGNAQSSFENINALFHMKSKICLKYFAHDCRLRSKLVSQFPFEIVHKNVG